MASKNSIIKKAQKNKREKHNGEQKTLMESFLLSFILYAFRMCFLVNNFKGEFCLHVFALFHGTLVTTQESFAGGWRLV
jgi:hypothetical protein